MGQNYARGTESNYTPVQYRRIQPATHKQSKQTVTIYLIKSVESVSQSCPTGWTILELVDTESGGVYEAPAI